MGDKLKKIEWVIEEHEAKFSELENEFNKGGQEMSAIEWDEKSLKIHEDTVDEIKLILGF